MERVKASTDVQVLGFGSCGSTLAELQVGFQSVSGTELSGGALSKFKGSEPILAVPGGPFRANWVAELPRVYPIGVKISGRSTREGPAR